MPDFSKEPTTRVELSYAELNYILIGLDDLRAEFREEARGMRGWSEDRYQGFMRHAKTVTSIMAKLRRKERAMRNG